MSKKTKISRKKKKHITRKKAPEKHQSHEDDLSQISDSYLVKKTTVSKPSLKEEKKEEIQLSDRFKTNQDEAKSKFPVFHFLFPHIFEITCLLLVTFTLYAPTLNHAFHLDDQVNIWGNSYIQISSLSIDKLIKAGFESPNSKRPVANISFALNYYFNGLKVSGFHIVNILIHTLTGIILFYFVKITIGLPLVRDRFGDARLIPFFTALIWLIHPLHTQSVTYIVQRMNSMAAMFFIMAMLFYVKGRLTPERIKKVLFYVVSFITGILALGSKQNSATLPFFILLYEWYFFQDLRLKTSKKQLFFIATLGGILAIILYFFLGNSPLDRLFPDYGSRPFTMAERLLTQPRVVMHYISLLFYPTPGRLNLDYDFPLSYSLFSPVTTFIAITIIIGMLGLALLTARKYRLYSFCILWFLGNLVIESSTIPLEIIFEHRTYLPSMMVIFLLVILIHRFIEKRKVLIVCFVSVTLLFSYWTHTRNKVWQDELTLWTDTQKKSPNKARANLYLGILYTENDRIEEAIPVLKKALYLYMEEIRFQKNVNQVNTAFNLVALGAAYMKKGEYPEAIRYSKRALQYLPYDEFIHYNLGLCYLNIGRLQKAVSHLSWALELSQHQSSRVSMQAKVEEIRYSLERAKLLLEVQKERKTLLKQGI